MAVVRRADHHRIEILSFLVEHLAVVLVSSGRFPLLRQPSVAALFEFLDGLGDVFPAAGIDVAVRPANIAMADRISNVAIVDAPYADKGDAQLVSFTLCTENGWGAEYPYAGSS